MSSADLLKATTSFNRTLKRLTTALAARYPKDPMLDRVKKRIIFAIDADPKFVIEIVGPYLYSFRDQIYSGDDEFFLANSFKEELKAGDPAQTEISAQIIPKMKEAWRDSDAALKAEYLETVQSLLDDYLDYFAANM